MDSMCAQCRMWDDCEGLQLHIDCPKKKKEPERKSMTDKEIIRLARAFAPFVFLVKKEVEKLERHNERMQWSHKHRNPAGPHFSDNPDYIAPNIFEPEE